MPCLSLRHPFFPCFGDRLGPKNFREAFFLKDEGVIPRYSQPTFFYSLTTDLGEMNSLVLQFFKIEANHFLLNFCTKSKLLVTTPSPNSWERQKLHDLLYIFWNSDNALERWNNFILVILYLSINQLTVLQFL